MPLYQQIYKIETSITPIPVNLILGTGDFKASNVITDNVILPGILGPLKKVPWNDHLHLSSL